MSRTKIIVLILVYSVALPLFSLQTNQPQSSSESGSHTKNTSAKSSENPKPIEKDTGAVTAPKVIHAQSPEYTYAASLAGVEGDCIISFVVGIDGKPHNIEVKKSLETGLDKNAVKAVKKYRFKPATRNGQPIPVRIDLVVAFHAHR